MYTPKTPKHHIRSGNKADKGSSSQRSIPNSMMNSMVNYNQAMENEADRVSAEVGASCNRLDDIKSALGSRLGVDFSNVKVHTDDAADRAARSYNARAFTKGGDVYLGKDGMNPTIAAHELVHTVQQGAVSGGGVMSAPEGQVQLWGKKKPAPKGILDLDSMNFGKASYGRDKDYKNLKKLMKNFNKSNGSDEDRAALMEAAMQYIDKNSRGKEAKHVGRTANAEKLLYQLSMDKGQQEKGIANIYNMKNQMAAQDDQYGRENQAEGHDVLNRLTKAVKGEGGFSNAMSMIASNVMADQGNSKYVIGSSSNTQRIYDSDNDPDKYYNLVSGRAAQGQHQNNVGTNFHEFTHASAGETYDNTRLFFTSDKNISDEDLLKRRDDRMQRMNEIKASFKPSASMSQYDFNGRYDYATGSKTGHQYAPNFTNKINELKESSSDSVKQKLDSEIAQIKKMSDPFIADENYKINDYKTKDRALTDAMNDAKSKNDKKGYEKYHSQRRALDKKRDFLAHDDTNIEYEPVINQMLIEHEMSSDDRSSQYYRQLKAAALRAHVDRAKARMKKNK